MDRVVRFEPIETVWGSTRVYVTNTAEGGAAFRVQHDLYRLDEWDKSDLDITTSRVQLDQAEFRALLEIEDVVNQAPPAILPIMAEELREIADHETTVYLRRRGAGQRERPMLTQGVFA